MKPKQWAGLPKQSAFRILDLQNRVYNNSLDKRISAPGCFMSKTSPRADVAYQALRQAIIEQALLPGTKLPEDQIGAHFGMSRTLVRATLARLQAEGLVDAKPKRTVTVAQPTLEEAREVFEIRRALEREAVPSGTSIAALIRQTLDGGD